VDSDAGGGNGGSVMGFADARVFVMSGGDKGPGISLAEWCRVTGRQGSEIACCSGISASLMDFSRGGRGCIARDRRARIERG
jgi:hypothetical protein